MAYFRILIFSYHAFTWNQLGNSCKIYFTHTYMYMPVGINNKSTWPRTENRGVWDDVIPRCLLALYKCVPILKQFIAPQPWLMFIQWQIRNKRSFAGEIAYFVNCLSFWCLSGVSARECIFSETVGHIWFKFYNWLLTFWFLYPSNGILLQLNVCSTWGA